MLEKLEFLSMAKDFTITKVKDGYEVVDNESSCDLEAFINEHKVIKYYLTGLYNTGIDCHEIDADDFLRLKTFCEMVVKQ